jgi:WD40 repeat protein
MFSSDGRTLVSRPFDGEIKLWDVASGQALRAIKIADRHAITLSPDCQVLACEAKSSSESVNLWDLHTGQWLRALEANSYWVVLTAAFSPDGRILATGLEPWPETYEYSECRETAALWDVASGRELRLLEGDLPGRLGPGAVFSVAFSPDGLTLASGARGRTIKLWDIVTGARRRTLSGLDGEVSTMAFSPDGWTLASGDENGTAALWNLAADRKPHKLKGHNGTVTSVAFSPDGQLLASGSGDKTIKLWDTWAGGREQHTLAGHWGPVTSVAFLPDSLTLASQSEDRTVKIWDWATGRELRSFDLAG